jgi:hypothetical protein
MTDLFEQTVQVLMTLAMSPDAETLDDVALNREVDPLIDAYLVWARTRRPAGFRPEGLQRTRRACPSVLGQGAPDTDLRANPSQGG